MGSLLAGLFFFVAAFFSVALGVTVFANRTGRNGFRSSPQLLGISFSQ